MFIRLSIAAFLVLGSVVMIAFSMNQKSELKITVKGSVELGIKLELPYFKESPADVIITNYGNHNLLAYKIRWEGIKYNGEVVERKAIKYHPEALLEKNQVKRLELLARQPLLAPNTKLLTGLGRTTRQITDKIPTLEDIGRDPELFPDLKEYKRLNVTLDGAILENGQVVGRDPASFDREIKAYVSEYLTALKEHNK